MKLTETIYLAKRNHNTKRQYLLVNESLAKHIPTTNTLPVRASFPNEDERVLVIGFAETATALGCEVASKLSQSSIVDVITTTRENITANYLCFKEEHSHATDQKMATFNFDNYDTIYFVDDEITTGKTLKNIISQMGIPENKQVFLYTLLNRADHDLGLKVIAEDSLPITNYTKEINTMNIEEPEKPSTNYNIGIYQTFQSIPLPDLRTHPVNINTYKEAIEETIQYIDEHLNFQPDVVIGTEEFMYPSTVYSRKHNIPTHSTTRSPIGISHDAGYPIQNGYSLTSFYEEERQTYIYNFMQGANVLLLTDSANIPEEAISEWRNLAHNLAIIQIPVNFSTYKDGDVTLLLKSLTGEVEPLSTEEREQKVQSGVSYGEMLPVEERPSKKYIELYNQAIQTSKHKMQDAIKNLANQIEKTGTHILVSLARAGTPVGVILKRYLEAKTGQSYKHYTISIIRGQGIDKNAMNHITHTNPNQSIMFIDGWTGKGAITKQLSESMQDYPDITWSLAVLADPAGVAGYSGTNEDFLIPNSCLNAPVSGMLSRTMYNTDHINEDELHGCIMYNSEDMADVTNEYIDQMTPKVYTGYEEIKSLADKLNIQDINRIKPGIGETTRVLLRRIPDKVLVHSLSDHENLGHIYDLAKWKNVPLIQRDMENYKCIGIIKKLSDV